MVGLLHRSGVARVCGDVFPALARRHGVPGAQLAVHQDGRTVAVEIGVLEHGSGRPVTAGSAFPVGSISKWVTATVAMALVADGDLELDAPVGECLPGLPEPAARVTLGQLLSHTAGWASDPAGADPAGASLRRYVLDHCRPPNVVAEPGTAFSYSNLGYALVGVLIETVSGMTWREATESVVLRPLGIQPGFVATTGAPASPRPAAVGHSVNRLVGRTRPVAEVLAPADVVAGGLALSAEDLVTLGLLHVGPGRPAVLPAADAGRMRRAAPGAVPFGLADGWGLGLATFGSGPAWVGHDGNGTGTSSYVRIDPADGVVVALTTNSNTGAGLWVELCAELAAAGVPVPPPRTWDAVAGSAAPPPAGAGTYRNGDMEYVLAVAEDGRLHLSASGDEPTPVGCGPDLTFALRDPATGRHVLGGRFVRDPATGEIDALQIGGRLARRQDRVRQPVGGRRPA